MADSPHVFNATQHNFEQDVVEASFTTPVLIDFWAPWCGPCKSLMPVLDKIVREANGTLKLAKVNTDEEMALAGSFGIRSLPTVVLFKDGRPVDGFMGAQPEGAIRALLAKHAGAGPAAAEVEGDEALLEEGEDFAAALDKLSAEIEAEPTKHQLKADLADLLLRAGAYEEGAAALEQLPPEVQDHESAKRARARLGFMKVVVDAPGDEDLMAAIARDGNDLMARYQLGCALLVGGLEAAALDQFLAILKTDRKFGDDLGRKALVDAFRVIRDENLVGDYRRRMTSLLF